MGELACAGEVCPHCGYDNMEGLKAQPAHVLRCGTILGGHYTVGRALGQGGFGITYIGYDSTLARRVCIKEYYPDGAALRNAEQSSSVIWGSGENAQELRRGREGFVKEARKAVKLRGLEAIVSVWDVFFANETAYIVMDYIDGVTIKDWLQEQKRTLGEKECVQLLEPILQDLHEVHIRGIIHRDISPDNIMLRTDQKPMLLDLGAAKDLSGDSEKSAYVVAKHGFTPLEQYSRQGKIGPWTDVYAMCATIYYCVTGKLPPTPMDRMSGAALDMSHFSAAVAAVLERGLAIEYEKRIASMEKLSSLLRVALFPSKRRRRTVLFLAGVTAAAAATVLLLTHNGVPPVPTRSPLPTEAGSLSDADPGAEELYLLGLAYEYGDMQKQDFNAAMDMYQRAAELGNSAAMTRIGALYYQGSGTEQSYEKALTWFQKAEEAGETDVLYYIGSMYEDGIGTAKDLKKAKTYYEKAKMTGSEEARKRLAVLAQLPDKQFLTGEWGQTEAIRNGTSKAFYLDYPCTGCSGLTMSLRIVSYTGYPFGEWYLYARDTDDNWTHIAQFRITPEQADGEETAYDFVFDSPQSFTALSICPAENGMEFELDRVILFYL